MKKLIGLLALVCIAIGVNAQILWKISGNGLEKPSYLFGTHHLAPHHILDSIKGWEAAFNATTQVVGELDIAKTQTSAAMQLMQQYMMMTGEKDTKDLFTPEDYEMVNTFVKGNLGFDMAIMPKLKPAFITNNIVVLLFMKHVPNYNPQDQLDTFFQARALEKNMSVAELETLNFQFDLLFNSTSAERQAEILTCMLSDLDRTIEKAKEMTDIYMRQDLEGIWEISTRKDGTACDSTPAELAAITDDRNVVWMEKIPAFMSEQPTFIVVGALHLVGEKGLINLLKEAGYTLEPVD